MTLILSGTNGVSDVDGSASTPAIRGTDSNTGIFFPAADTIAFAEGGAEVARFDSSGNFGLGVTPAAFGSDTVLAVYNASTPRIKLQNSTTGTANTDGAELNMSSSDFIVENREAGNIRLFNNGAERARITSAGDFLVGKTTAGENTGGTGTTIFTGANAEISVVASASTSAQSGYTLYSTGASAYRFYVGMQGQIYATNTTISAISDQRFKENIQDLDVGLGAVMALKPRKFDWKEGKGKDIKGDRGFIAQEFEQVFPDMIDEWRDPAPEGEEPYKSVRADLIPVLVKAIQEQQALINDLTARIAALEAA